MNYKKSHEPVNIIEDEDGVMINGHRFDMVKDIQVKENLHQLIEVEVTFLASSFTKKQFGNDTTD